MSKIRATKSYSNHYKRLYETSKKVYDKCYNPELTSNEIRAMIAEELRKAYRLGFADGNNQTMVK